MIIRHSQVSKKNTATTEEVTMRQQHHHRTVIGASLFLLWILLIVHIRADIPVHCVHENIANNEWLLHLTPSVYALDNFNSARSLSLQHVPMNCTVVNREELSFSKIIRVYLKLPNKVLDADRKEQIGTWTMVYDQGFEVTLKNSRHELSMFAFSNFETLPKSKLIKSKCYETFVGNYRKVVLETGKTMYGCYYAKKTHPKKSDVKVSLPINTLLYKYYDPKGHGKGLNINEKKTQSDDVFDTLMDEIDYRLLRTHGAKSFKNDHNMIEWINTQQDELGWSARAYPHFEEMNEESIARMGGSRQLLVENGGGSSYAFAADERKLLVENGGGSGYAIAADEELTEESARRMLVQNGGRSDYAFAADERKLLVENGGGSGYAIAADRRMLVQNGGRSGYAFAADDELTRQQLDELLESAKGLPENFDWRNVSGQNFVPHVKDQQACGSCYAFAAVTAIESRIRIMTNNSLKPHLAVQDIISCSPFAQKCHGGIPYSVGRHLKDFTLVPESCFKYQGSENVPCESKCTNPEYVVKVKNYTYVGSYYGASNDLNMQQEIYKHGPVAVSYLIYPDFKYYSRGIYKHSGYGYPLKKNRVKNNMNGWEPTTHSVVVTGWGKDPKTGQKFWNVLNSWSEMWGDMGYFKIARGHNEAAIEAEAVAYTPIVIYNNKN